MPGKVRIVGFLVVFVFLSALALLSLSGCQSSPDEGAALPTQTQFPETSTPSRFVRVSTGAK
jgi:hypothetical protein